MELVPSEKPKLSGDISKGDLALSIKTQVNTFLKENAENGSKDLQSALPKKSAVTRKAYKLAGDISQVIARTHSVRDGKGFAQKMVEDVIQEQVIDRVDIPDEARSILEYVLMDTLPRMIGGAASRWFSGFDRDGDGKVSKEEFAKGVSEQCCCGCECAETFCGFVFPCARLCCGSTSSKKCNE